MKVIETKFVPVESIVIENGFNIVRGNTDASLALDDLVKSMVSNGYLEIEPLAVKEVDGQLILRKGHRRVKAIARANKQREKLGLDPIVNVPVNVTEATDQEWLKEQIIGNMGLNPTPMGYARVYAALQETGMGQKEIASETGTTATQVSRYLKLLDAPQEVQDAVDGGKIAGNTVINDILMAKDKEGNRKLPNKPKLVHILDEESGEEVPDPESLKEVEKWERKVTNEVRRKIAAQGGKGGREPKEPKTPSPYEPLNGEEVKLVLDLLKTHPEIDESWINRLLVTDLRKVKFEADSE